MSDEIKDELAEKAETLKEGAVSALNDVREEAQEVAQEAQAAFTGQTLDSASVVGGAGYRADNKTSSPMGIASLVLGIISILAVFIRLSPLVGLVLGIVGVVLGAMARKESQTGIATGGFVCSIIGIVINAIFFVCALMALGTLYTIATSS